MKRENLKRANIVSKQLEEIESNIRTLERIMVQFGDEDKQNDTVELRIYPYTNGNQTIHHIFTYEDIVAMTSMRKEYLVDERRVLLNELDTL